MAAAVAAICHLDKTVLYFFSGALTAVKLFAYFALCLKMVFWYCCY